VKPAGNHLIDIPRAAAWSFALTISASSIFVLIYGPVGLHGNGVFTASFLCLIVAGVAFFSPVRNLRLSALDIPLLVFLVCAAISFAMNPLAASVKELILFAITMSAYFAGRLLTKDHIPILKQACFWLSGFIVFLGTAVTLPFLVLNWMAGQLGRPFVFGFDNAATAFSVSLGFLVIAISTSEPNRRLSRLLLTTIAPISISAVALAASMVRFSLLAIIASSGLCFLISGRERKFSLILFVVLAASVATGWFARPDNAKMYAAYTFENFVGDNFVGDLVPSTLKSWYSSAARPPSYEAERNPQPSTDCLRVNTNDSIAIRKQLLFDGLDLMPRAGLVGFGLKSFGKLGCFKDMSPHNDLFQAIIEFGWLGGAAFATMISLAPVLLFSRALWDRDMRFLFLLCAFMIMLSMSYGDLVRELSLFMTMGVAVSTLAEKHASVKRHHELLSVAESA
jgi:hypothetical protein